MGAWIDITLPLRTRSESNLHEHWRARQKRAAVQRAVTYLALRAHRLPPLPAVVTLTRIAPRGLDISNIYAAMKHVQDGVSDWLGVDDGDPRVLYVCEQSQGAPKQYAVRFTIHARAVARIVIEPVP